MNRNDKLFSIMGDHEQPEGHLLSNIIAVSLPLLNG